VPTATRNFVELCSGVNGKSPNLRIDLSYANSKFYRIFNDFALGGDIYHDDGTGNVSIFNEGLFSESQAITLRHSRPNLVSMEQVQPGKYGSRFAITFNPTPWRDGDGLVVGEIMEGTSIIRAMRDSASTQGVPLRNITVTNSGELSV
jgi:cyclophilin family peptidyl-prolyl cis-trans isomerase